MKVERSSAREKDEEGKGEVISKDEDAEAESVEIDGDVEGLWNSAWESVT